MKKSLFIFLIYFLFNNLVNSYELIIFLGQPGAGKGTQSQMLSNILRWPVLGASNIVRAEMLAKSELSLIV